MGLDSGHYGLAVLAKRIMTPYAGNRVNDMHRTAAAYLLFLLGAGLSGSVACVHREQTLVPRDSIQAAREAADRLVRDEPNLRKEQNVFLRTEDHGDEIWVMYNRRIPNVIVISCPILSVAYNKKTGKARWINCE
jgi:hypothetical protein